MMKTAFLAWTLQRMKAQQIQKMESNQKDKIAITEALEKFYFEGIYEGNLDLLNQVYKTGTLLFGDVKGQKHSSSISTV
jgi:hypothetical protein